MSACRSVRDALHREATTLSDADRLLLEDHLEGCKSCLQAREHLLRVRELARAMPLEPLGPQAHQRALSRALLAGAQPSTRPRWNPARLAFAGGIALCAIAAALWLTRSRDVDVPQHQPMRELAVVAIDAAPPMTTAVAAGTITRDGVALPTGSEVATNVALSAIDDARLVLPGAQVSLLAGTSFRWLPEERSFVLGAGVVDVDVDPAAQAPLRVVTEQFTVEVVGTAFRVTPQRVEVSRGTVRIVRGNVVLVERLTAGETWTLDDKPIHAAPKSPRAELEGARQAFNSRNCKAAEQHANAALGAKPSRAQEAEARTILAECAQTAGRLDDAVRGYDLIATRFADLPAGETALIAAARLEVTRGRATEARMRYERYVARYPSGRFVDDARRYLDGSR